MPDPRFFDGLPALSVAELAERIGGEVSRGGDRLISAVAPLASAEDSDVAFLGDRKFAAALGESRAGCIILPPAALEAAPAATAVILSEEPQAAWARASLALHRAVSLTAIDPGHAAEDDSVVFEPGVVLGQGVRVGRGSRIGANTVIGPGVQIGRDCVIGPHVSIAFALVAAQLMAVVGLRAGGGVLLLWVSWKLWREPGSARPVSARPVRGPDRSTSRNWAGSSCRTA